MEFIGIILVSFCCTMFIHLGLGETLCEVMHLNFILFRCVKCLTFWTVLVYALFFTELSVLVSASSAFLMSYLALWVDIGLAKLANIYDYLYEKTTEDARSNDEQGDSGEKGHGADSVQKEKKDKDRFLS